MGEEARSLTFALTLAFYALCAFGPRLPSAASALGDVPPMYALALAAGGVSVALVAFVAGLVLGTRSPVVVALRQLDLVTQVGVFGSMIYLGGSASTPLWTIGLMRSFVWSSPSAGEARWTLIVVSLGHLTLIGAFLANRRFADASLTGLMLLAFLSVYSMSRKARLRTDQLRQERDVLEQQLRESRLHRDRDRIARELHDGLGADITALVLRLRRAASDGDVHAVEMAARAEQIIDELRPIVWSLRNERGTLAELKKLVDASCRKVCARGVRYESTALARDEAQQAMGPATSVAVLSVARELVTLVSAQPATGRLCLAVGLAARATQLRVTIDRIGEPVPAAATSERFLAALSRCRGTFNWTPIPRGDRWGVVLPLES